MAEYQIKLLSLNVRGLRGRNKRTSIFQYVKEKRIDICFLQETHCTLNDEIIWANEWMGDIHFSNGTNLARGVIILIKPGIDLKVELGVFAIIHCEYAIQKFFWHYSCRNSVM